MPANERRRSKAKFKELFTSQSFSAMPTIEAMNDCLNLDVCELVGQKETIEVETLRHQPSTFPRNNSPETYTSVFQLKIVRNMAKTKLSD